MTTFNSPSECVPSVSPVCPGGPRAPQSSECVPPPPLLRRGTHSRDTLDRVPRPVPNPGHTHPANLLLLAAQVAKITGDAPTTLAILIHGIGGPR
jgi:hypothetical protein